MRPSAAVPPGPCWPNARRVQAHIGTTLTGRIGMPRPATSHAISPTRGTLLLEALADSFGDAFDGGLGQTQTRQARQHVGPRFLKTGQDARQCRQLDVSGSEIARGC